MSRLLLAWELGGSYGHVAILRSVAQELRARGHECFFAVRELRAGEEYLPELGPLLQGPRPPERSRSPVKVQASYASLLHNTGFDDPVELAGRLRAWGELMQTLSVDAVLANHAPVALLAARALDLPRAQFGASFCVPPDTTPFPSFQPQLQVRDALLRHNEAEVLRALNQALERLHRAPLENLQQIFGNCHTGVFGYRELDTYDPALRKPGIHLGLPDNSHGEAPSWATWPGPRVFCYLRRNEQLQALMQALQASRLNVLVRITDLPPEQLRAFERPGLVITGQSIHMRQAAETCDAMIHNGPDGTTTEMLLAGKPGLLMPLDLEKMLVSARAQQMGAVLVSGGSDPQRIGGLLEQLVEDASLRRNAEDFATRYRKQDRGAILPAYAEDVLAAL
jgi:UDP:flavonoid glycosyltransferase YjiC (YdhE family)